MNSNTINSDDLAVAKEIIPFLRLRLRILKQRIIRPKIDGAKDALVVMPCIIGDFLSYLPAVRAFADKNHTPFDIVVSPNVRSLAERLKGVRRVFVASSSYQRPTEQGYQPDQAMPPEYDLMIVLRLSQDAFDLIKGIRCRNIVSSDATLSRYICQLTKSSLLNRPVVQSREMMFKVFGLRNMAQTSDLYNLFDLDRNDCEIATGFGTMRSSERRVLIHTGSGWKVKQWSDDSWISLLTQIHGFGDYEFYFVGRGDEERHTFERIQRRLDFEIHTLINVQSLWELFLVMKCCDYFIGIDSGPSNLAHYANLRSITLLNPAAVKNFMPFDARDIVVENPNRFPANIVNTRKGATLAMIGVEEVFHAFQKLTTHRLETPAS